MCFYERGGAGSRPFFYGFLLGMVQILLVCEGWTEQTLYEYHINVMSKSHHLGPFLGQKKTPVS